MIEKLKIMIKRKGDKVKDYEKLIYEVEKEKNSINKKKYEVAFDERNLKSHAFMISNYISLNSFERKDKIDDLKKDFKFKKIELKERLMNFTANRNLIENCITKISKQENRIKDFEKQFQLKLNQKSQVNFVFKNKNIQFLL